MKCRVTAEEPGLSNIKHDISEHDTTTEARDAALELIEADILSGDALSPTYRVERS